MRISDWSSDVCSSDLIDRRLDAGEPQAEHADDATGTPGASHHHRRVRFADRRRKAVCQLAVGQADGARYPHLGVFFGWAGVEEAEGAADRKSTRLNSSH